MSAFRFLVAATGGLALVACAPVATRQSQSAFVRPVQSVRHGSDSDMLYHAGRVFQERRRYDEAILAYSQALLDNPAHVEAHNGLGVVYSLTGHAEAAEREFRAAIALAPDAAHLRNNLAFHLMGQGRTGEALTALEQARELEPSNAVVTANIAAAQPAGEVQASDAWGPTATPQVAAPAPPATAAPAMPTVASTSSEPVIAAGPAPAAALASPERPAQTAARPASDFHGYRIEFSNGNGTSGLASRTSQVVAMLGFERPRLTNDKPYGRAASQLQYVAGAEAAAQAVNARLPVQMPLAEVARLDRDAKVRVLLGNDFPANPPVATASASAPVREAAARQP